MATDRDEVAVAEAIDWLQRQARGDGHPRPTVAASTAAGYARELLHELERLAAVERLAETPPDEVARLRAVEQRAIDVHTTGARDAVLSMAHYILTGETSQVGGDTALDEALPADWWHCSPALLAAGVPCGPTPRRSCQCEKPGSHDHFVDRSFAAGALADRTAITPPADTREERLQHLATLAPNWDTYGGVPPTPAALERAREVLALLDDEPRIYPVPDGGVQLVWSDERFEVEARPGGDLTVTITDEEFVPMASASSAPTGEVPDLVNHPTHYTSSPSGVECIQITEHLGFCIGNAIKYLWRADEKGAPLDDLRKARWYIDREIARRERLAEAETDDLGGSGAS